MELNQGIHWKSTWLTDWTMFNYSEFIETEYFKERNEKVRKRVAEEFKKEFEGEEEGSEEGKDLVGLPF